MVSEKSGVGNDNSHLLWIDDIHDDASLEEIRTGEYVFGSGITLSI